MPNRTEFNWKKLPPYEGPSRGELEQLTGKTIDDQYFYMYRLGAVYAKHWLADIPMVLSELHHPRWADSRPPERVAPDLLPC